jgi:hypothetical protein
MVDREYIEKNIDIIFDFEKRNLKNDKPFNYVNTFGEINVTKKMKNHLILLILLVAVHE